MYTLLLIVVMLHSDLRFNVSYKKVSKKNIKIIGFYQHIQFLQNIF